METSPKPTNKKSLGDGWACFNCFRRRRSSSQIDYKEKGPQIARKKEPGDILSSTIEGQVSPSPVVAPTRATLTSLTDPLAPQESPIELDGSEFIIGERLVCGSCDLHLGTHPTYGEVALKKSRVDTKKIGSEARRRFEREAAIWKRVSEGHRNILPFLGIFTKEDQLYLVSPFMRDGDAISALGGKRTIEKFRLLVDIACGLSYLHRQRVIHGDIKGANVIMGKDGEGLICDFGLAKIVAEGMATSTNLQGAGSICWMAPELVCENSSKTTASDVFSFGMTIIEILTGKRPYSDIKALGEVSKLIKSGEMHLSGDPSHSPEGEPYDGLWALSKRCRHWKARKRPNMAQVHEDILAIEGRRVVNLNAMGGL